MIDLVASHLEQFKKFSPLISSSAKLLEKAQSIGRCGFGGFAFRKIEFLDKTCELVLALQGWKNRGGKERD